jgi:hypothetical protein
VILRNQQIGKIHADFSGPDDNDIHVSRLLVNQVDNVFKGKIGRTDRFQAEPLIDLGELRIEYPDNHPTDVLFQFDDLPDHDINIIFPGYDNRNFRPVSEDLLEDLVAEDVPGHFPNLGSFSDVSEFCLIFIYNRDLMAVFAEISRHRRAKPSRTDYDDSH